MGIGTLRRYHESRGSGPETAPEVEPGPIDTPAEEAAAEAVNEAKVEAVLDEQHAAAEEHPNTSADEGGDGTEAESVAGAVEEGELADNEEAQAEAEAAGTAAPSIEDEVKAAGLNAGSSREKWATFAASRGDSIEGKRDEIAARYLTK